MVKLIHQATQFLGCGCLPSLGFIIPSHCPCKNLRSVIEGLPCYLHRIFAHWMQTNKMVPDFQLFETYASRLPLSSSAQEWPQIWAISLDWGRQGCIHMTWVRPLSPLFFFLFLSFLFPFFSILKTWHAPFINASSQLPCLKVKYWLWRSQNKTKLAMSSIKTPRTSSGPGSQSILDFQVHQLSVSGQ